MRHSLFSCKVLIIFYLTPLLTENPCKSVTLQDLLALELNSASKG